MSRSLVRLRVVSVDAIDDWTGEVEEETPDDWTEELADRRSDVLVMSASDVETVRKFLALSERGKSAVSPLIDDQWSVEQQIRTLHESREN